MERSCGVLMHISSLFGDYSVGSFGKNAEKFIDFLAECGFSYWQTLPFCMPDKHNSPYKSYSAFSVNPYFIDLEILAEKGYITRADLENARQNTPYFCEFDRLGEERLTLLKKAARKAPKKDVEAFIADHPQSAQFCRFMARKEANGGEEWPQWTKDSYDEDVLFAWQFIQYEFFAQWLTIKEYANKQGIKIIGDMPMFVDFDSSDVYDNQSIFLLDENGRQKTSAGVPPDYFAADGQVWGNPHYDWDAMEKDGFAWWKARFSHMLTLFDGVRIDHFRGLEAYFSIPYGDKTAKNGNWVKAKGREMLEAVKPITDGKLIIAEDLGDIDEAVRKLVDDSGFPGMRVMQFGFLSPEDSPHRFHNYINNSIAYTGTHDNNTLLGYVWEMSEEERQLLFDYVGYTGDLHGSYNDAILRCLYSSAAGIVMLPIQDLLMFGRDTRINIPGKEDGNWSYRITEENMNSIDRQKYQKLSTLYAR